MPATYLGTIVLTRCFPASENCQALQDYTKTTNWMAALLVLLLLLAVPLTAFSTNDVYYVTADDAAGHEHSCPPHQICHNLSYYISQPDSYFTSDTTIIFLVGDHSFDIMDVVGEVVAYLMWRT